jgi:hypothetical protein
VTYPWMPGVTRSSLQMVMEYERSRDHARVLGLSEDQFKLVFDAYRVGALQRGRPIDWADLRRDISFMVALGAMPTFSEVAPHQVRTSRWRRLLSWLQDVGPGRPSSRRQSTR